jgi:hypothetical protein
MFGILHCLTAIAGVYFHAIWQIGAEFQLIRTICIGTQTIGALVIRIRDLSVRNAGQLFRSTGRATGARVGYFGLAPGEAFQVFSACDVEMAKSLGPALPVMRLNDSFSPLNMTLKFWK